jgi:signal transduction histidine kinase
MIDGSRFARVILKQLVNVCAGIVAVYAELLDDARQANRQKDQFLAAVSHELRAPLTTMLLWERVLRENIADAELRQQALDAIHESAMVQSRLVSDLLDVSRAISGKLYVDLRPVDVTRILEDALDAIASAMEAQRVAVERRLEPGAGLVQGDALRLRQVFDNLLANALKFSESGGRVVVSTRRAGGSIEIAIADSGRGIPREFLPRLFQPFSQTDDALTRTQGGLGLGLTIAHQLVTLHGGTLRAESPGLGLGATFTVTLKVTG